MEALAAITVPQILEFAYNALCFAWQQYENVQGNQTQCHVLIRRCQDLLLEVSKQIDNLGPEEKARFGQRMIAQLQSLEGACLTVKSTVRRLANKGFAWRLLHQDKIKEELAAAESAVADAFQAFNLGAHMSAQMLQVEIASAQSKDQADLIVRLDSLASNDKKILTALQDDSRGRKRLEELILALDKHVKGLTQMSPEGSSDPAEAFIRTASSALQRMSGKPAPEIPHWAVTSLEVTFDPDDEENCIGKGGFGNIYKGEWNGQVVAVKEMYSEDARLLDRDNLKHVRHEIMIWSRIAHPHVLPFYCACLEATRPFIVTRFCGNGNVLEYLRASPNADRISLLHEVSLGMTYLHSQGIVHADLKGSNVLVGDDGKALITDFGLSSLQDQVASAATRTKKATGTLRWMAPELLDGEPLDKPADVYSFALLAWELYTGAVPFGDIPERAFTRRVVDKQERPQRPSSMEDGIWGLVQQYWVHDPSQRPVFGTIQTQLRSMLLRGRTPSASVTTTPSTPGLFDILPPSKYSSQNNLPDTISPSRFEPTSNMGPNIVRPSMLPHNRSSETDSPSLTQSSEPPYALFDSLRLSNGTTSAPNANASRGLNGSTSIPNTGITSDFHWSGDNTPKSGIPRGVHWADGNNDILNVGTGVDVLRFGASRSRPHTARHASDGTTSPGMATISVFSQNPNGPVLHTHTNFLERSSPGDLTCVAIDDDWIAVGLASSEILVYDAVNGGFHKMLLGHTAGVWDVELASWPEGPNSWTPYNGGPTNANATSSLLLSGGTDHSVRVWDVRTGECLHILKVHKSTVRCIKALPGVPQAVTGGRDGALCVWAVRSGRLVHKLTGHMDSIRSIAVHNRTVVSASYDSTCRIWDVDNGICLSTLCGHTGRVYSVAFDGRRIASGGEDKTVRIWDAQTYLCQVVLREHTGLIGQLQLSPTHLVSAGVDGMIIIYTFQQSTVHAIAAHDTSIVSLQLDLPYIISGSTDGSVKMWEAATGAYIRHVGKPGEPTACPWKFAGGRARSNTWVISGEKDGKAAINIWTMRK